MATPSMPHISTSLQSHPTGVNGFSNTRATSSTSLPLQNRPPGESEGALYRAEVNVQERGRGEEKSRRLAVAITSPSQASRRVTVVVTDPADHFFYYSLNLPEEDFPALRAHQGLLVDFLSFPGMLTQVCLSVVNWLLSAHQLFFIQLVEKCVEEGRTVQPRFVLVLNCSGPQVSRFHLDDQVQRCLSR